MEDNLVSENKIFEMKMNTNLAGSNLNNVSSSSNNNKFSFYNQFPSNIREELDNHVWELISYNPIKFIVAHSENKQIVYTRLKEKVKKVKSDDFSLDYIEEKTWELEFSRVVIGAIPLDVNMIKNPLGLFDQKYIIKFLTHSGKLITIGPKSIDEIIMNLKEKSLLFLPSKATEALSIIISAFERNGQMLVKEDIGTSGSIIISAFERNGQMLVKEDIGTSGFYFIDKKIKSYNNSHHPRPKLEQIVKCCELLEILQSKFKKKDVFPTLLKWSIVAPFDYIFKQVHKKWIPWLYPYGWSNTGKSTLGELCCCIWNRYLDKDAIISSTAVDTKARFGEVLSKSTYPILINEVAQLHDDKYRDMVEMFKTAITDLVARKKFVNKTIYTEIPSFSPCILTGNSIPPSDTGFRRRIIPIIFTEKDQYSKDEIKDFENLFEQRIMKELRVLGDFTVNYIMENQEILIDGKKDWKEIAEYILEQMFKLAGKEHPPEWIKYFVEEYQLQESKEDVELLFRNYLINKINDTYNRYYRNIEKILITNSDSNAEIPNLPFSNRLNFCLEHNLIPFLNPVTIKDGKSMIIITSDLIYDIKNKIPSISSLNEVSQIIEGFEYGQKKLAGRNVRAAYGSKKQFLDFLGLE